MKTELEKLIKHYPPVVFLKLLKDRITTQDEKATIQALLTNTPIPRKGQNG